MTQIKNFQVESGPDSPNPGLRVRVIGDGPGLSLSVVACPFSGLTSGPAVPVPGRTV